MPSTQVDVESVSACPRGLKSLTIKTAIWWWESRFPRNSGTLGLPLPELRGKDLGAPAVRSTVASTAVFERMRAGHL